MRGKRIPPKDPVVARMRITGPFGARRILNCDRCGQRLPTLTYLRFGTDYERQAQIEHGGLSPDNLYIDWREMPGWSVEGETLRPTELYRERRQRAREKVRTAPQTETELTRLKLAGRAPRGKGLVPNEERWRHGRRVEFPIHRPVPRQIECPQCHVENLVPDQLTAQSDVE